MTGFALYSFGLIAVVIILVYFIKSGILIKTVLPLRIFSLTALIIGGLFLSFELRHMREFTDVRSWPKTNGYVISSEVVGERAFRPHITYLYSVNGDTMTASTDMRMPPFGGRRSKFDAAQEVADHFPSRSEVTVYYNPENPEISHINAAIPVELFLRIGLAVLTVLSLRKHRA